MIKSGFMSVVGKAHYGVIEEFFDEADYIARIEI